MNEKGTVKLRPRLGVSLLAGILVILMVIVLLFILLQVPHRRHPHFLRVPCMVNLRQLGLALAIYANENGGQYPLAGQWCDLLTAQYNRETGKPAEGFRQTYRCPKLSTDGWGYAMNPNARPNGDPNVVLVFESDAGWNGLGGPESLATARHRGDGCNVLLVDGSVRFVKVDELADLRWTDEDGLGPELRNARRPQNDGELEYWLENMIWHHRFSTEEVRLATGLTEAEIATAQERFGIWPGDRPARDANGPLLVLAYPGGRHPRIGFLEGAIDPQRETKFSVFTPWDPNSYVVVDVPEAIWSNLGLTYLAHTHVDTIWTQQGIELPRLEWNRRADGSLDIARTLPNGLAFTVTLHPERDTVRMEIWLRNGTDQSLSDLRVQNCVMTKMAARFAAQTNENKVFTNPYVACRSEDGNRWIITAWEACNRPWGNEDCPCFHSDPKFPDLAAGQEHRLAGWLSFYEGEDIEAEFARIEATGWRLNQTSPKP